MNIKSYLSKYTNRVLQDDGAYLSAEFRQFAKDFRSVIAAEAKAIGAKISKYSVGHYYVSGFMEQDGKYVYFSYEPARQMPIATWAMDAMNGILIRTAKGPTDYLGGMNHFTCVEDFRQDVSKLFAGGGVWGC